MSRVMMVPVWSLTTRLYLPVPRRCCLQLTGVFLPHDCQRPGIHFDPCTVDDSAGLEYRLRRVAGRGLFG